jgi:hypothetical protein
MLFPKDDCDDLQHRILRTLSSLLDCAGKASRGTRQGSHGPLHLPFHAGKDRGSGLPSTGWIRLMESAAQFG